jgi:hypothetical protein
MNLIPPWALALLSCFVMIATTALARESTYVVNSEGHTELTLARPRGKDIHVVLWQAKARNSYPYKDAILWGGDVGELPHAVLSSVQIQEGGETVPLPLSAYGDLGDVESASLKLSPRGFALNLHGSDGAGCYNAILRFAQRNLVERNVSLCEFPEVGEKSTYFFHKRSEN